MKVSSAIAALCALLFAGAAQAFPDRPITVIVPFAAGGGADTFTRSFAAGFEKELGVPVTIVNRTGFGGITGHSAIISAPPDGYTLGVASPEIAFYKLRGVGTIAPGDLDLVSRTALLPAGLTVRADAPWKTLDEFLADLNAKPKGTLTASGGPTGGSWHIALGGFLKAAGLEADHVTWTPNPGSAASLLDLQSGGIDVFAGSAVDTKALHEAGRLRTLVVMTDGPSPFFPGLPTAIDQNVHYTYSNWYALVAPKGLPPERRARIADAAKKALARPEVEAALKRRGVQPVWDDGTAFTDEMYSFLGRGEIILYELGVAKR